MPNALATLTQLKEFIGNSADNTDDALLTRLLDASADMIERSCNRTFAATIYTETRDGNGHDFMVFSNRPVTAVGSISVDGRTIPQSTGTTTGGWVLASSWKVALRGQYLFTEGVQNVTMTYTAGYASNSIPPDLTQACCLVAALAYKERDRMGISAKTIGGENISFTNDELPPSAQQAINNHRNYFVA
ncbi:MAG: hypothetical protein LW768_12705 [Rubrivivax sp.]|nr:hypothetical protein [Rubrivivax sp.]